MRSGFLLVLLFFQVLVFSQGVGENTISEMDLDSLTRMRVDSIKKSGQVKISADTIIAVSTKKQKKIDTSYYSPKKAALLALACPGLGQIYNKKYWKLPIVYGAMGGTVYWVTAQAINLRKFNGYIVTRENGGQDPYANTLTLDELVAQRDLHRRNVQLASFATMFVWGLSIMDAAVDAHLRAFDVSDKLSMQVKPKMGVLHYDMLYAAININFKLK